MDPLLTQTCVHVPFSKLVKAELDLPIAAEVELLRLHENLSLLNSVSHFLKQLVL